MILEIFEPVIEKIADEIAEVLELFESKEDIKKLIIDEVELDLEELLFRMPESFMEDDNLVIDLYQTSTPSRTLQESVWSLSRKYPFTGAEKRKLSRFDKVVLNDFENVIKGTAKYASYE